MNALRHMLSGAMACLLLAFASSFATADEPARVLPGEDLQRIVNATPEGATLILAPGIHRGPIVVDRRMTLRGMAHAQLVGSGAGSVLTLKADGIHIDNLQVSGSGRNLSHEDAGVLVMGDDARITNLRLRENLHGVYVRGAKRVQVLDNEVLGLAATEDDLQVIGADAALRADSIHHSPPGAQALMGNGIHLWNANGAVVTGNLIRHVRDGIYVAHTNESVFRGNRIHDSRYGIHYMYSNDNVVEDNELWRNVAGPALMFSRNLKVANNVLRDHDGFRAYGLLLQNIETSGIHGNEIRGNRVGMRLQNSYANTFTANHLYGNLAGMTINSSSRGNAFTRNDVGFNLHQIELTGPAPPTHWSVEGVGNRWHGSLPLDLTGDGISEWPHHEVDLMAERRESFPYVQLLTGSPGIRVMEWALKQAPVPGLRHITDPHPLTRRWPDD